MQYLNEYHGHVLTTFWPIHQHFAQRSSLSSSQQSERDNLIWRDPFVSSVLFNWMNDSVFNGEASWLDSYVTFRESPGIQTRLEIATRRLLATVSDLKRTINANARNDWLNESLFNLDPSLWYFQALVNDQSNVLFCLKIEKKSTHKHVCLPCYVCLNGMYKNNPVQSFLFADIWCPFCFPLQ